MLVALRAAEMSGQSAARNSRGRRIHRGSPIFTGDSLDLPKPYRRAVIVEFSAQAHSNMAVAYAETALKMAMGVDVLLVRDTSQASRDSRARIDACITEHGLRERAHVEVLGSAYQAEQYFKTRAELDLVIADRIYFHRLMDWNDNRKKQGFFGYDILCGSTGGALDLQDAEELPTRAFRQASIGGTFNALHDGHRKYIRTALQLADDVHVFIADDDYARERKPYKPYSLAKRLGALRAYTRALHCSERIITQVLRRVEDIETYVRASRDLDVVVTERDYFDWFDEWNEYRKKDGRRYYNILCKERTTVLGANLTSSMLAEIQSVDSDTDITQYPLF
jgi:cytidyltransferase-like protein